MVVEQLQAQLKTSEEKQLTLQAHTCAMRGAPLPSPPPRPSPTARPAARTAKR